MPPDFMATAALRATALLALGLVALRWLPCNQPHWRRAVALFCLAASLVIPFVNVPTATVSLVIPSPNAAGSSAVLSGCGNILAAMWILGLLVGGVRLSRKAVALRLWMSECQDLGRPSLRPSFRVLVSPKLHAPCVAGFLKPVLIVPEGARDWSAKTWRCVLAHEMQHWRQGDLLLGWISHLARVMYWWHPMAHRLDRELGLEAESCCDLAVLWQGVNAGDYARELLRFATNGQSALPVALSISGRHQSSLGRRLERMLGGQKAGANRWRVGLLVVAVLCGVAGTLCFAFTRPLPVVPEADQTTEADLRLTADPFPADAR